MEQRFDGAIAGLGTTSGVRLVVGMWPRSPLGPIADVMVERPDGHRILVAPSAQAADYIAGTYSFDEVRVEPTAHRITGAVWSVAADTVRVSFAVGRRTALGQLLSLVPRPVARNRAWCAALDPIASRVKPGVHTVGSAGNGRREYYCAFDEHAVNALTASLDGADLGALARVEPPVRFGFGSSPARPSLVRVTTRITESSSLRRALARRGEDNSAQS
ncbi:hypothetical protein [uncultured Jatrophihabitans sp.]|uniref:hypothetical protein n=1 Tax=uncultured Jatrophihabitans sp. TaxID=1610747 RepID=UPI0035C99551